MKIEALQGQRVYLDTNALIYAFEGTPARQSAGVTQVLEAMRARRILACASLLVRAEVMVQPVQARDEARVSFYRELFARSDLLRGVPLNAAAADLAALLRALHPALKLIDALHLAVAEHAGCAFFLSADRRLRAAARGRVTMFTYADLD